MKIKKQTNIFKKYIKQIKYKKINKCKGKKKRYKNLKTNKKYKNT